jgi:methylmalonyl-CoA/ethylmalonyl-CoA epimerase
MNLKLGQLAQIAYPVVDVDRSAAFFQDKLGLKLLFRPHDSMAFFDLGGIRLFVERARNAEEVEKASILYLSCEDIAKATAELEARGVEIVSQPHCIAQQPTHDLWMSFFRDPDGHLLALEMQAATGWKPARS